MTAEQKWWEDEELLDSNSGEEDAKSGTVVEVASESLGEVEERANRAAGLGAVGTIFGANAIRGLRVLNARIEAIENLLHGKTIQIGNIEIEGILNIPEEKVVEFINCAYAVLHDPDVRTALQEMLHDDELLALEAGGEVEGEKVEEGEEGEYDDEEDNEED